jgi:hypothetical protein
VEARSDDLAGELVRLVPQGDVSRLTAVLEPIARRIAATGVVSYPNPIGVPLPDAEDAPG